MSYEHIIFINGIPEEYDMWPSPEKFPLGTIAWSSQFSDFPWSIVGMANKQGGLFWDTITNPTPEQKMMLLLLN